MVKWPYKDWTEIDPIILELHSQNVSQTEIAEKLKLTRRVIVRRFRQLAISGKRGRRVGGKNKINDKTLEETKRMLALRDNGWTLLEIANQFNVTKQAVHNRLKKARLTSCARSATIQIDALTER